MSAHTIAEAVEITGLTAHTLRYYERDGLLLTDVDRDSAGRRLYSEGDLTWIELVRAGEHTQGERLALLRSHRAHVMEQLAEITDHLGAIDRKIGIYEDRLSVRG
ncbi:MAG: MerR family transcriptional regulator [Actinomycetales bacterium]|nr:MAG: MerR family transcriptional regulator [Actinomycetales bacterium]